MNKKSTKILGIIIGLLLIAVIIGIVIYNNSSTSETNKESTAMMDNFYKYMESKKEKVIYYGSDTCSYCSLETPIMKQIKKDYKIDYLYVSTDKLTKEDNTKVKDILDIKGDTPTIAVVKEDYVVDVHEGYLEGKEMVKFLIKNEVLDNDAVYKPEQYLTDIDYEDYEEIISNGDLSIIVIGQTTCSHCIATKPVLNHIAGEYEITINYLNLTNMDSDEQTKLTESLTKIGYEDAENLGTPLTLIVQNSKLVSTVEGENPTSYYIRSFKKAGVITEDE